MTTLHCGQTAATVGGRDCGMRSPKWFCRLPESRPRSKNMRTPHRRGRDTGLAIARHARQLAGAVAVDFEQVADRGLVLRHGVEVTHSSLSRGAQCSLNTLTVIFWSPKLCTDAGRQRGLPRFSAWLPAATFSHFALRRRRITADLSEIGPTDTLGVWPRYPGPPRAPQSVRAKLGRARKQKEGEEKSGNTFAVFCRFPAFKSLASR
jgi:hypothetical protein